MSKNMDKLKGVNGHLHNKNNYFDCTINTETDGLLYPKNYWEGNRRLR